METEDQVLVQDYSGPKKRKKEKKKIGGASFRHTGM